MHTNHKSDRHPINKNPLSLINLIIFSKGTRGWSDVRLIGYIHTT